MTTPQERDAASDDARARLEATVRRVADRMVGLEREVRKLRAASRAPQLPYSTVEGGAVIYRDGSSNGTIRHISGRQPDGTFTSNDFNAPRPPRPSPPEVTPIVGGFKVRVLGTFEDDGGNLVPRPLDWKRTDVHVDLVFDFDTTGDTVDVAVVVPEGATATFITDDYQPHYVKLVAVNTSGTPSYDTEQITVTPIEPPPGFELGPGVIGGIHLETGAVTPEATSTGTTSNLIPDPAWASAAWRAKRDATFPAAWAFIAGTGAYAGTWFLGKGPTTISADAFAYPLDAPGVPVLPGERYFLSVSVTRDANALGKIAVGTDFYDENGTRVLGFTDPLSEPFDLSTIDPGSVDTLVSGRIEVPGSAATMRMYLYRLDDPGASAGAVYFQRVELRSIIGASSGGGVEASPEGVVIIGADGAALGSYSADGSLAATYANFTETMTYRGVELADLLNPKADGLKSWGSTAQSSATTTSETGIMELAWNCLPGRMFALRSSPMVARGGVLGIRARYTLDGSRPSVSSPLLTTLVVSQDRTGNFDVSFDGAGQTRILVTVVSFGASVYVEAPAGDRGIQMRIEDIGSAVAPTGVPVTGGGGDPAPTQTRTDVYPSIWSRSYHAPGTRSVNGRVWQGRIDNFNGENVAVFGFDWVKIRNDLAGATINWVEVYLHAEHWYFNSGGEVCLGMHNAGGPLNTYPEYPRSLHLVHFHLGKPEARWTRVPNLVAARIRDGTDTGLVLDSGVHHAGSLLHYGYFRGAGDGRPAISVNYTK